MYPVLLTIHVIVSLLVVLFVLIQAGRSGGLSGLMGGGGGDALFSTSAQQSGLRKITVVLAAIFFCTSFGLTLLSSRQKNNSVFEKQFPNLPIPQSGTAPATPIAPAPVGGETQK